MQAVEKIYARTAKDRRNLNVFPIVRKKVLNPSVTLMEISAPYIAAKAKIAIANK